MKIRFNAPTKMLAYVSIVLAVLGLLSINGFFPSIEPYAFWIEFSAFAVLMFGCVVKGA